MGMTGLDHDAIQNELHTSANAMMSSYWDSFCSQGTDVNSPAELAPALQVALLQ